MCGCDQTVIFVHIAPGGAQTVYAARADAADAVRAYGGRYQARAGTPPPLSAERKATP